jgi:hypothetical protein
MRPCTDGHTGQQRAERKSEGVSRGSLGVSRREAKGSTTSAGTMLEVSKVVSEETDRSSEGQSGDGSEPDN